MRIEMAEQISKAELEQLARKHLWPCFSPLSETGTYPLIVSGDGCYVFDDDGKRYLDGLAGLFLTNVGHGRTELADAAPERGECALCLVVIGYGSVIVDFSCSLGLRL
jgi:adenosylmethionine-8-amino-7-oxononanoate aminotransferase